MAMERKNRNLTNSDDDDLLPILHGDVIPVIRLSRVRKLWNSLKSSLKLSTTKRPDNSSLPTLPFDLITEILSRLPVKLLVQFRCVCKSWNSLITDPKFARKHFNKSTTRNLHAISYRNPDRHLLKSYPLQSVFTDITSNFTIQEFPFNNAPYTSHDIVGSCHGILCLAAVCNRFIVFWNPSIRKFKTLPPPENLQQAQQVQYGFGYDHVSHYYKVLVLYDSIINGIWQDTTKVKLYTSSTNSWTSIQTSFPFNTVYNHGTYVRNTINWLAFTKEHLIGPIFIVSFELGKDSFQKILTPAGVIEESHLKLSVLRDCLCILCLIPHSGAYDFWVMKEYGIQESWTKLFKVSLDSSMSCCTKLFKVPFLRDSSMSRTMLSKVLYIFEDDQVLLEECTNMKFIVYNSKNSTFKVLPMFLVTPEICLESLISPCS